MHLIKCVFECNLEKLYCSKVHLPIDKYSGKHNQSNIKHVAYFFTAICPIDISPFRVLLCVTCWSLQLTSEDLEPQKAAKNVGSMSSRKKTLHTTKEKATT